MEIQFLLLFFIGLVFFYLSGRYIKSYLSTKKDWHKEENMGIVEGSLLALFAFFLGFSFSISASKLENVRQASISESNAIGTVILRTEMYDADNEIKFKGLIKDYLKTRIDYFNGNNSREKIQNDLSIGEKKSHKIWNLAVDLQKTTRYVEESRLMLPALNDMIDSVTTRDSAINASLPKSIIITLLILSFCSTFIIGFSDKKKSLTLFIDIIYIVVTAITVLIIIDAGNPRTGFINTTKSNETLKEIYKQL